MKSARLSVILVAVILIAVTGCREVPGASLLEDARPGRDASRLDAGSAVDVAAPDAAGAIDGGEVPDAGWVADSSFAADAQTPIDVDGGGSADATARPLDCSGLLRADTTLCSATSESCQIVFYDRSGCNSACERGGMTCRASFRDDDDNGPVCAPHPSGESYGCSETNHMSDYCECVPTGTPPPPPTTTLAFVGAEGFGARAEGGRGGRTYTVTNLNDSGAGSLRWAVERSGRRIVEFDVDGVIQLRSALRVHDPYLTIDGRGALANGGGGITLRDYPIDIRTHDVIIRYIRVRLGDWAVLRRNDQQGISRPRGSDDLDCINIHRSRDVIIDHVSMSWSTDEIVSVTNSRNITIQWSILSEPIGNRATHPYGDNHAFGANNSAATLTYHHNLFAHYVMRGPQFEANDMQDSSPRFDAKFEAVNNVMYGYTSSGSRYRTGFERSQDRVTSVDFMYHFVGNRYVHRSRFRSEITAHTDFGEESNIKLYVAGNIGPNRTTATDPEHALVFTDTRGRDPIRRHRDAFAQVSTQPLFTAPTPVTVESAEDAHDAVLSNAGCTPGRDAIDDRIVADVRANRLPNIVSSQEDVPGGWPSYR